jgi:hypothetical protein
MAHRDEPDHRTEEEAEAFADKVYELLNSTTDAEVILKWIEEVRSLAYLKGYQDGITDESMAAEAKKRRAKATID